MAKYKHLTIEERRDIEQCLNKQKSFKEIGKMLNRDPATISKEVVGHIKVRNTGGKNYPFNACKRVQSVCKPCHHPYASGLFCARCGECNSTCSDYEEERCPKLGLPPYVCNGCKRITCCQLQKQYYYADFAQQEYEAVRSESRQGIAAAPEELQRMDAVISPLIKQGQSIHHICSTHTDEIMLNEKTIYNYIDASLLSVGNIDLPRKVRYRRRQKKKLIKLDRGCYEGRTYQDFQRYVKENPDLPVAEMDSVEGKRYCGKVLLTMFFRTCSVMLAYLRDANTARSVADIIEDLYERLGHELYCELFPIILTDRGSEFTNPFAIECTEWGEIRSRVFYCDPQKSKAVVAKLSDMKLKETAKKIADGIEETLTYADFPSEHWTRIRTNNVFERLNREIRRRTRVVGYFPDGNSALMLVCARLRYVAGTQWGNKKYMNMKHLEAVLDDAFIAG